MQSMTKYVVDFHTNSNKISKIIEVISFIYMLVLYFFVIKVGIEPTCFSETEVKFLQKNSTKSLIPNPKYYKKLIHLQPKSI
jgi:hypothetical protein